LKKYAAEIQVKVFTAAFYPVAGENLI